MLAVMIAGLGPPLLRIHITALNANAERSGDDEGQR